MIFLLLCLFVSLIFLQMQLEIAPFLNKVSEMHNSYLKGQSILMFQFSWKSLDGFKYLRKDQWVHNYSIEIRGASMINDACCITLQILCSKSISIIYLMI